MRPFYLGTLFYDRIRRVHYFDILPHPLVEDALLHDRHVACIQSSPECDTKRVYLDPSYIGSEAEAWNVFVAVRRHACGDDVFAWHIECVLDWREWERAE